MESLTDMTESLFSLGMAISFSLTSESSPKGQSFRGIISLNSGAKESTMGGVDHVGFIDTGKAGSYPSVPPPEGTLASRD